MNRPGLRSVLSEKFLEVFGWFESELEAVQTVYESQKVMAWIAAWIFDAPPHKVLLILYVISLCQEDIIIVRAVSDQWRVWEGIVVVLRAG